MRIWARDVSWIVHHQVPDGSARHGGNIVILQHPVGPHLEVGEIHDGAVQQELAVPLTAAAQGGDEGPAGTGEDIDVDQLVADAVEIAGRLGRRVGAVAPAAFRKYVPVGAEYGLRLLVEQRPLLLLADEREFGTQPHQACAGVQQPVAQAVDGGDLHLLDIAL